jgi:hypothetical protein
MMGYRSSSEVLMIGTSFFTSAGVSHSASTPLRRFAFTRRVPSRTSGRLWARFTTPRWLNRMS